MEIGEHGLVLKRGEVALRWQEVYISLAPHQNSSPPFAFRAVISFIYSVLQCHFLANSLVTFSRKEVAKVKGYQENGHPTYLQETLLNSQLFVNWGYGLFSGMHACSTNFLHIVTIVESVDILGTNKYENKIFVPS